MWTAVERGQAIEAEAIAQAFLLRAKDHRTFYESYKAGKPAADVRAILSLAKPITARMVTDLHRTLMERWRSS